MLKPRFVKIMRDLQLSIGRMIIMIIAIAVTVVGVGAVLSAYAILTREISRNYLETEPASATFEMDSVNETIIEKVKSMPGIREAEARSSVLSRIRIDGEWRPLLLFVIKDFDKIRIARFKPENGAWPPPSGSILFERQTVEFYKLKNRGSVEVKTPNGPIKNVNISGTAHDPGLAPAWQERMGYGFITRETFNWLGENGILDELKIIIQCNPFDATTITKKSGEIAARLTSEGFSVKEIQIPPPGKHPHQNPMTALLVLLLIFSILALILSAILSSTLIAGILAKETRQIGIMKAVGATTVQIAILYLLRFSAVIVMAIVIGLPLGVLTGRTFATVVATMLNFTLYSNSIPVWVSLVQITAALTVPLLFSLLPILKISRMTILDAMNSSGAGQIRERETIPAFFVKTFEIDRTLILAVRNTFRRKARLIMTVGLIACAGALFITALNVQSAWNRTIADSFQTRKYSFEMRLNNAQPVDSIVDLLRNVETVRTVEPWGFFPASTDQFVNIDISHTYPDGGHGSFNLLGVPSGSDMVNFPLINGRWINRNDTNGVVLNQVAYTRFSHVSIGDTIVLNTNHTTQTKWRLLGVVKEIGPAAAYADFNVLQRISGVNGYARVYRIALHDTTAATRQSTIKTIDSLLTCKKIGITAIVADSEFRNAIMDHIFVLIGALIFIAVLMAIVGILGLSSTISTNIVERTRELAVMRAIGGTPAIIFRNIFIEGVFIGILSLLVSVVISLFSSSVIGMFLGNLAFTTPLPLVLSCKGIIVWSVLVFSGVFAASGLPAWRTSKQSIHCAFSIE